MSEDASVHIADILEAIERIRRYVGDLSYAGFIENEMLLDAVIRNLMIIGEARRTIRTSSGTRSSG